MITLLAIYDFHFQPYKQAHFPMPPHTKNFPDCMYGQPEVTIVSESSCLKYFVINTLSKNTLKYSSFIAIQSSHIYIPHVRDTDTERCGYQQFKIKKREVFLCHPLATSLRGSHGTCSFEYAFIDDAIYSDFYSH